MIYKCHHYTVHCITHYDYEKPSLYTQAHDLAYCNPFRNIVILKGDMSSPIDVYATYSDNRFDQFCALNRLSRWVTQVYIWSHRYTCKILLIPNDEKNSYRSTILLFKQGVRPHFYRMIECSENTGDGGDHKLILGNIKMRVKKQNMKSKQRSMRYNMNELQNQATKQECQAVQRNCFPTLQLLH